MLTLNEQDGKLTESKTTKFKRNEHEPNKSIGRHT